MSVINKVLRDLDKRESSATRPASDPVRRFTVGVDATTPPRRKTLGRGGQGVWPMVVLLLLAAGGAAAWWYLESAQLPARKAPLILQLKDDDVLNLPAATAVAPAEKTAEAVRPAEPVAVAVPTPATPVEPVPEPKATPVAVPSPQPALPVVATPPATAKTAVVAEPLPKPVAPPPVVVAPDGGKSPASSQVTVPPPAQRQQQAARDALAQAQTLWNTSAQETAVSTLQAAVAVAERQDSAGMLVPLVRELARMELALGHPAEVLDLLVRLEPQLKNQPDLWAVRANAAQRLGRHQDSVLAYGVALQSRPAEARWLLGMAVSLAAMGQITQAGAMVEKARASGPISAEVALYLRQQGVPMPEGK
jgi:MSHA biogenesis protein MshN